MSTYVAVFAMVLAYVALVAAYVALRTLAKVRRSLAAARGSAGARPARVPEELIQATQRNAQLSGSLAQRLDQLREHVDETTADLIRRIGERSEDSAGALRNVALVRYDAFGEMSGRMSFSLALLDDKGDGVTISAIAGRSDTSVYAKGITAGQGEHELSPEEQQAVSTALHRPRHGLLNRRAG
jgi:tetrahydromethanopterin S-methyltransferase subunit G